MFVSACWIRCVNFHVIGVFVVENLARRLRCEKFGEFLAVL
jgi:hypothetical protein